jgi:glycosyltransferase involved in cell wall biosynthesis
MVFMHVCLLTWGKYPHLDTAVREIGRNLAKDAHVVELVARSNTLKYRHKKVGNCFFHWVPSFEGNELMDAILVNMYIFFLLVKINKRFSLDAIQCTSFGAMPSSFLSKIILRIPLIYNIRAPDIDFCHPFWMPFHLLLIKKISDKVFGISSAYKNFLNIHYKVPSQKIEVISCGADPSLFSPQIRGVHIRKKYNIKRDDKVLVYVGTLAKARRLEILLTAFKKVKEEMSNVKLFLVGDGDGKEDLLSMSRELKLLDSVIFTGYVTSESVPSYIAASDIAVSHVPDTPYYSLSSPTKTFEYMAMGKPIVASKILPHTQIISNEVNGILVDYDDPHQYAQTIIHLLTNERKAREIGVQARKDVLIKYNWETVLLPMKNYLITLKNNKTRHLESGLKIKMLVILEATEAFNPSASEFKLNILTAMMNQEWKAHIINSRTIRYENLPCGCEVHKVPLIGSLNSVISRMFYLLFSLYNGVKIVKKYDINIVTCRAGHLYLGSVAYLISRITGRKCLIRVNENSVLEVAIFLERTHTPILSHKMFVKTLKLLLTKIENFLFTHVDWIVTQGPMDYERIREITEKITFLPLWVDTESFKPLHGDQFMMLRKEFINDDNTKIILFVGRLSPEKDIETLLYAFKKITEINKDAILIIVGTGVAEEQYKNLAKELNIADRVKFLGYIPNKDLPIYYNIADIYVITSIWEELSNTIMEAMACGVPVIATNVGGNPYLVKDGETGFLVPPRKPDVLAKKITYVLDRLTETKEITLKARQSLERYTKEIVGQSYKQVIINLCSK